MYCIFLLLALSILAVCLIRSKHFKAFLLSRPEFFSSGTPQRVKAFYENRILGYSMLGFKQLLKIKTLIFVSACIFLILVKLTNIQVYTENIFESFDYKTDLIYQEVVEDKNAALEEEILFLNEAIRTFPRESLSFEQKEELQFRIKKLIEQKGIPLSQPLATISNKVYYRLHDYYAVRHIDISIILFLALLLSFVPELYLISKKTFSRAEARKELNLLKKIMIVAGSIKPVDFMQLLNSMISRARFHKKVLQQIKEANILNSIDNKELYKDLIKNEKDLSIKLFYEKLDQVNNYDFDQAIMNIKNEFYFERREAVRNVKKRIEAIHIWGILGFTIIIVFYMAYLIIPWLQAFDMNKII